MKVVIPAAGLGTRLLPATKEQPKEMLPLFVQTSSGGTCIKPLLQIIFEQLYKENFRKFCFITGRTKRSVEDHFTPDFSYLNYLHQRNKHTLAEEMGEFYRMLEESVIFWVNQPEPRGFGDAVRCASSFILEDENFLVYAGDNYILSPKNTYLRKLVKIHEELKSDATFIVDEVKDPRQYGVMVGEPLDDGVFKVLRVVEKPEKPPSKMAIHAIYVFNSKIFDSIIDLKPDASGEIQLTDAIQRLIDRHSKVHAIKLGSDEVRIDIGDPISYWNALKLSYSQSPKVKNNLVMKNSTLS